MKRILVLRGGALGDFIVTLPALALLRQRWPEARIELVGNVTAAQLALRRGLIDAAHSQHEARWSALYGKSPLPDEFAAWLREFDLVLNYWPDPERELRSRFPLRGGQEFLTAEAMPAQAPAAAHYCAPLRALGLQTSEYFFRLSPAPSQPRGATIVIHPGSGSPRKNWPRENWIDLIARLPPPVSLIVGEAERDAWNSEDETSHRGRFPVIQEILRHRPLEELVSHLAACGLFLGHDSGISHLAAACGAKCVLLFGPTEAAMWAPPAPNVQVLQAGPDLRTVSVAAVWSAVQAAISD